MELRLQRWFVVASAVWSSASLACSSNEASSNGSGGGAAQAGAQAAGGSTGGSSPGSGATTALGGGAGTAVGGSSGATSAPEGLGDACGYGCSSPFCGGAYDDCATGYCLWDSRFFAGSYCTMPCDGTPGSCPEGFACREDDLDAGVFWCGKAEPEPAPDLGDPCSSSFNANDCSRQQVTRHCNRYTQECSGRQCVRNPAATSAYCSTPCSTSVPCPDGYECRPISGASTFDPDYCFAVYQPEDIVGASCEPGVVGCDNGMLCVTTDSAELCPSCLADLRLTTREFYCTISCDTAPCPVGFDCLALDVGGGSFCAKQR